jgi:hypothetical protein
MKEFLLFLSLAFLPCAQGNEAVILKKKTTEKKEEKKFIEVPGVQSAGSLQKRIDQESANSQAFKDVEAAEKEQARQNLQDMQPSIDNSKTLQEIKSKK